MRPTPIATRIWDIFRVVVASGDTYAFDPDISRDDALAYWMQPANHCHVAERQGRSSEPTSSRPTSRARLSRRQRRVHGRAERARHGSRTAMGEHCLAEARRQGFRAMQFNFVVSTTSPRFGFGNGLGSRSSARCRAPSATRQTAMSPPM
jgi:hypothetical protein